MFIDSNALTAIFTGLAAVFTGVGAVVSFLSFRQNQKRQIPSLHGYLHWDRSYNFARGKLEIRNRSDDELFIESFVILYPSKARFVRNENKFNGNPILAIIGVEEKIGRMLSPHAVFVSGENSHFRSMDFFYPEIQFHRDARPKKVVLDLRYKVVGVEQKKRNLRISLPIEK